MSLANCITHCKVIDVSYSSEMPLSRQTWGKKYNIPPPSPPHIPLPWKSGHFCPNNRSLRKTGKYVVRLIIGFLWLITAVAFSIYKYINIAFKKLYEKIIWNHNMVALREWSRCLRNIAMRDYQESKTTRQTRTQTDGWTDAGQSDPYVTLCFVGN